mmetsp:Transcript_9664/g.16248  ORF Transcript_9664/g.16248 Transcript_9664/m.16248 type:complete len:93 (-) Transcript_9664:444-722(-)
MQRRLKEQDEKRLLNQTQQINTKFQEDCERYQHCLTNFRHFLDNRIDRIVYYDEFKRKQLYGRADGDYSSYSDNEHDEESRARRKPRRNNLN